MTSIGEPNGSLPDARRRRRKQRIALAGVLGLIIIAALLTPEIIAGRSGDPRLTTYSAGPQGARLLFELTRRLGWSVERWTDMAVPPATPHTVIAVLDPVQPLGAIESHELLNRVRAGSGLLYVMDGESPLNDSLHLRRVANNGAYEPTPAGTADAPETGAADSLRAHRFDSASDTASSDDEPETAAECAHADPSGGALPMWMDQTVWLWSLRFVRPAPNGTVIFARSVPKSQRREKLSEVNTVAAAGFPLGRGRVVVLSDPDFLRNDVLRVCRWGLDVVAMRALDYLALGETSRNQLVFDEYHQGFGTHPGTMRAIIVYLSRSPSGHLLLQAMAAGLLLLLALGPRLLPAHDPERVERRSPLEHVSALAQAYERVGGTRTATARLVRGLRRRVERGAPNDVASGAVERDRSFLDNIASMPELAGDAALVRRALNEPITEHEFAALGLALERIENTLLTTRR